MQVRPLIKLFVAATLGALIVPPLASAGPLNPSQPVKKADQLKKPKKKVTPAPKAPPESGGYPRRQAFGGKKHGVFTGTLMAIGVGADGSFVIRLEDPNTRRSREMSGCDMRLKDIPFLDRWIGRGSKTRVTYHAHCVDSIAILR